MKLGIRIIAFVPWLYIVLFYSYVIRVSIAIGHFPSYNNPDPSYLYIDHRNLIYQYFGISFLGSIVGLIILTLFHRRILRDNEPYVAVFLIGVLILLYNLFLDPLDTWFLD